MYIHIGYKYHVQEWKYWSVARPLQIIADT